MRFRRIALLIGLYLALDFATPALPGAVQLVGGALEAVDGCRARNVDAPAQTVAPLPRHLVPSAPREPSAPAVRPLFRPRPMPALVRLPFEPRST